MKRLFDFVVALVGLVIMLPILVPTMVLIWLQDFQSPLYLAPRMRSKNKKFKMVKLRTMVVDADQAGGSSTAGNDKRVTWIGRLIRKFKLDEFSQLWNVVMGDMSLVGPRPQEPEHCNRFYTKEEFGLFEVRSGITDFSSIVFSDEGEILNGSDNPDLKYNQLIRPWKSRLGLLYVQKRNFWIDLKLILLTLVASVSRPVALQVLKGMLRSLKADEKVIGIVDRKTDLYPYPPPGSDTIETRA